jgi:hypothetical protein
MPRDQYSWKLNRRYRISFTHCRDVSAVALLVVLAAAGDSTILPAGAAADRAGSPAFGAAVMAG